MLWRRIAVGVLYAASTPVQAATPPSLMLWVWERPADLRGLPRNAGVGFLACTVLLKDGEVHVMPRFQPLRLAPDAFRMSVIRVVTAQRVLLTQQQRQTTADVIVDTVRVTRPDALQIDFDARTSERAFYSNLLRDLRARLGPNLFLSITALVSWCGKGSWIERLPVDEVVPMTFQMGFDSAATETRLRSGGQFESRACQASIGIATSDLDSRPRRRQRTYVFAYGAWTDSLVRSVLARFP